MHSNLHYQLSSYYWEIVITNPIPVPAGDTHSFFLELEIGKKYIYSLRYLCFLPA